MSQINSTLFPKQHIIKEQQACPECGGEIIVKFSKHGPFKACTHYPKCRFVLPLTNNDGHIIKTLGVACPECSHELVLRQGRFGMFIGCSAYPGCLHIEKREQDEQASDVSIPCPECKKGALQEKRSRFGKKFYACNAYPKCKFAVNAKPIEGQCSVCGYALLLEKQLSSRNTLECANKQCQHKQG